MAKSDPEYSPESDVNESNAEPATVSKGGKKNSVGKWCNCRKE